MVKNKDILSKNVKGSNVGSGPTEKKKHIKSLIKNISIFINHS